ncbi:MAG: 2-oxoisovalerate dehydrogenase [Saprospiraceae bacterium]|nr:2-oxoisovalerate dehydrogenase [Saprospiraceae bacterium]
MSEIIFIVKEAPEGGFEAEALGFSIFTEAENWDDLKENIRESVICHFDDDVKRIIRLHFVKEEVLSS